jgi:peptidoglycan hydrolase-like protein with peptidoglycan-binding domain
VTAERARVGQTLADADVLMEVNGRPVFAIESPFTFYRNLEPGQQGPDISALQRALRASGFVIAPSENGSFGESTSQAVRSLYAARGYAPAPGGPPDGGGVPLTEIATAPELPARVTQILGLGQHPSAESGLATVGAGQLVVEARVPNSAAVRLRRGMPATATVAGTEVRLTVTAVRAVATSEPEALSTVVLAPSTPLTHVKAAKLVQVTIIARVLAKGALLVPSRAVARDASGQYAVLRSRRGHLDKMAVDLLGTIGGVAALRVDDPAELTVSDKVKVG